jgi:hypothetical protein
MPGSLPGPLQRGTQAMAVPDQATGKASLKRAETVEWGA